jgi:hypothetical protein
MEVTIKKGKVAMDVIGGSGPSCEDVTKAYENRLAEGPVDRVLKPEHGDGSEEHRVCEFGG